MLITHNEIAIRDKQNALAIMSILVEEDNVVMLSKEEDLYIINFEYSQYSNRNDVVFLDREYFDAHYVDIEPEENNEEEF